MDNTIKKSLLVPYQLPAFIRDNPDYETFVSFIQAYYQWMEQTDNIYDYVENFPSYIDIDQTTSEFLNYYTNEFLQYFPEDILISKSTAIKLAKEIYQSKGTPASYQLLFRILYNSDFYVEYTKDYLLKASAGSWYVAKSLKLDTTDVNFLQTKNYRVFGQTSKSIATIENAVLAGNKTEIFISNIERLFQSGEIVSIVDNYNQPVLINGEYLSARIVGQISQINIDPDNRGLLYQPGDPVVVYGGLNPNISYPVGATAVVSNTTTGSIQNITVVTGGYGYTNFPNTIINITNAPGANAIVASLNPNTSVIANVSIPLDTIGIKKSIKIGNSNYGFTNTAVSNANTTLAKALTFTNLTTYPISSVLLINGGGNISQIPQVSAISEVQNDYPDSSNAYTDISTLGILAPIQIANGGSGYKANDIIKFVGGPGFGANAIVSSVDANGSITAVKYVTSNGCTLGGLGYKPTLLPSLVVNSANNLAANAQLFVPGIIGLGATFSTIVNRIGSVSTIQITNYGEDYVSAPSISLKVQDILVSNTSLYNLPQSGDVVYQGPSSNTATYTANVYSITKLVNDNDPTKSLYSLRVYDYSSQPNPGLLLNISKKNIHLKLSNTAYASNTFYPYSPEFNSNGVKNYGDGKAKANASFLDGLVISQGQYIDTSSQPSSYSVLQSEDYNNFTYKITVQKEIAKYRDILLNLLHPTGTKLIGRYALKSNNAFNLNITDALYVGKTLQSYTGFNASGVTMAADFNIKSNNIVSFNNLAGANLSTFIFAGVTGVVNSTIEIVNQNGANVKAEVIAVDNANSNIKISSNVWLTFANVAYVSANTGSNVINILSVTNSYDIVNNQNYSNSAYHMMDIARSGDNIKIGNSVYRIQNIDYINNKIYANTNVASNTANSLLSVNKNLNSQYVKIFGAVGLEYVPELTAESGLSITTEDGNTIILE